MTLPRTSDAGIAWPLALAAAAVLGTLAIACMMPFVALAVAAALSMSRARAAVTISGIWATNQLIGFGLLSYPLTGYALSWGGALLGASLGAMLLAARLSQKPRSHGYALPLVFLAAFAAFEVALLGFALVVGGTETFTPTIVLQLLTNDVLWFAGLFALHVVLTRAAPRVFGPGLALRAA
ncbi:hypothetical protein F1C10_06345 [Sphingomonas sp. NBWT7]|uniref:hypothetical protein n=1 Tax=Sphingomonas sp. NBWT7 TaxID=2596913 RepID=UPI001627CF01|nr:hypothetical protein [Sphingomonas sp. NBWT7]QNE31586.1 hypothetical protein F1C10_06345 [Sphingomonas sp. NBWT7]